MKLPTPANDNQIDTLYRLKEVMEITKLGSSTVYRMMDSGTFPRPLRESGPAWGREPADRGEINGQPTCGRGT
jgi:predicted DNA-binding transcriptional regulator AlpA